MIEILKSCPIKINKKNPPPNFVYLDEVDSSIVVDLFAIRTNNFLQQPLDGYNVNINRCIVTYETAIALKNVQRQLLKENLSLKIYDGYRPQRAINDLINQLSQCNNKRIKQQYFPQLLPQTLSDNGFISVKSAHSRGSTVDVTLIRYNITPLPSCNKEKPESWVGYWDQKHDVLDMGCGVSAFDKKAHMNYKALSREQIENRRKLRLAMESCSFFNSTPREYWHFTLRDEPYPESYFDFTI